MWTLYNSIIATADNTSTFFGYQDYYSHLQTNIPPPPHPSMLGVIRRRGAQFHFHHSHRGVGDDAEGGGHSDIKVYTWVNKKTHVKGFFCFVLFCFVLFCFVFVLFFSTTRKTCNVFRGLKMPFFKKKHKNGVFFNLVDLKMSIFKKKG